MAILRERGERLVPESMAELIQDTEGRGLLCRSRGSKKTLPFDLAQDEHHNVSFESSRDRHHGLPHHRRRRRAGGYQALGLLPPTRCCPQRFKDYISGTQSPKGGGEWCGVYRLASPAWIGPLGQRHLAQIRTDETAGPVSSRAFAATGFYSMAGRRHDAAAICLVPAQLIGSCTSSPGAWPRR